MILNIENEMHEKALKLVNLFMPGCDNVNITAKKCDGICENPEGYALKAEDNKAFIKYQGYLSLRNALATLSLKAHTKDGKTVFENTDVVDFPAISHRGFMLDQARGVMPIDRLFYDMVLIAKMKYNVLHLHFADSAGIAIEMDCLPKEYHLDGYFTKAQVKELIDFADLLGLEIIPEFDMPAHSTKLNELFPGIRCDTDTPNQCLWTTCAGTEETYTLYREIIKELSAVFEGARYFHIGGDELEFADLDRPCHWQDCKKCRQRMKDEGLADRQELLYYFTNRINKYVKECGKQTVIWSDQIDCTRPKGLDDDILLQFWRVAAKKRGPHEGCSFEGQLKYGYNAINSYYPDTYVDMENYVSPEKLGQWRWDESPEVADEYKGQIIGSEVCAWEYGNRESYAFYDHVLPSCIVLFGNKFWSGKKEVYDKNTALELTRAVLGSRTPDGFDVFEAIGSILPPRFAKSGPYTPCYIDKVKISKKEIEQIISTLSDDTLFTDGDKMRADFYKECAEYTLNKKFPS